MIPTEIKLHSASRVLEVSFDDGQTFRMPCEYLRVFSPSADARTAWRSGQAVRGKESVNISRIEPVGSYAVRLVFDDGHHTGIYSWRTLYELGRDYEVNWQGYLERIGERRGSSGGRSVTLLYFAQIASRLRRESDLVELPDGVANVSDLLALLAAADDEWRDIVATLPLEITVNKSFAGPDTKLHSGDEIAFVIGRRE
jgi:DUF971 family protein/molybdopterin converting factor small subunit